MHINFNSTFYFLLNVSYNLQFYFNDLFNFYQIVMYLIAVGPQNATTTIERIHKKLWIVGWFSFFIILFGD